jgi:small subunit ribosomal protein S6
MNKYEVMLIIKPDLSEEEKKNLFNQINEVITKNSGSVSSANIWQEKRKLCFTIKKQQEGTYYLVDFSGPREAVDKLKYAFKLNDNILRALITRP